ncbi:hypothetical protein [Polynucleobacter sp.]|uniref:hypothetical protein n=1 Tax=Polynucleobacter sp. TaxID=2029855 RepID=UPI003F69F89E
MKYQMRILANAGYNADQVKSTRVGDLKDMIADLEDSDEIVLNDQGNARGANFGEIYSVEEIESEPEDIEEFLRDKPSN